MKVFYEHKGAVQILAVINLHCGRSSLGRG